MHRLRSLHRLKQLLAVFMLLSLLVQIETVFACHMMANSGPIKHCCCAESKSATDPAPQHSADDGKELCCDFNTALNLNDSASDSDSPWAAPTGFSLQLSYLAALISLAAVLMLGTDKAGHLFPHHLPGHAGTYTWLYTQRLRI